VAGRQANPSQHPAVSELLGYRVDSERRFGHGEPIPRRATSENTLIPRTR
jgi:hypothetical protein